MNPLNPMFVFDGRFYLAANKDAAGLCAVLSRIRLRHEDLVAIRSMGHIPRLMNGEEIGKLRIDA